MLRLITIRLTNVSCPSRWEMDSNAATRLQVVLERDFDLIVKTFVVASTLPMLVLAGHCVHVFDSKRRRRKTSYNCRPSKKLIFPSQQMQGNQQHDAHLVHEIPTVGKDECDRGTEPPQKKSRRTQVWHPGRDAIGFFGRNRKIGKPTQMLLTNAYLRVKQLSHLDREYMSKLFNPVGTVRGTTLAARVVSGILCIPARTIENHYRHVSTSKWRLRCRGRVFLAKLIFPVQHLPQAVHIQEKPCIAATTTVHSIAFVLTDDCPLPRTRETSTTQNAPLQQERVPKGFFRMCESKPFHSTLWSRKSQEYKLAQLDSRIGRRCGQHLPWEAFRWRSATHRTRVCYGSNSLGARETTTRAWNATRIGIGMRRRLHWQMVLEVQRYSSGGRCLVQRGNMAIHEVYLHRCHARMCRFSRSCHSGSLARSVCSFEPKTVVVLAQSYWSRWWRWRFGSRWSGGQSQ